MARPLILFLVVLFSFRIGHAGAAGSGGGDPDAVEFLRLADQLYDWLANPLTNSPIKDGLNLTALKNNLQRLKNGTQGLLSEENSVRKRQKNRDQKSDIQNEDPFLLRFVNNEISCFGQIKPACTDETLGVTVNRLQWKLDNSAKKCETVLLEMQLLGVKTRGRYEDLSDPDKRILLNAPCATNLSEVLQLEIEWLFTRIETFLNTRFVTLTPPSSAEGLSIEDQSLTLLIQLLKIHSQKQHFKPAVQTQKSSELNTAPPAIKTFGAVIMGRQVFEQFQNLYREFLKTADTRKDMIDLLDQHLVFRDEIFTFSRRLRLYQEDLENFRKAIIASPVTDAEGFLHRHKNYLDSLQLFMVHFGDWSNGSFDRTSFWGWNPVNHPTPAALPGLNDIDPKVRNVGFLLKDLSNISLLPPIDFKFGLPFLQNGRSNVAP